MRVVIATGGFDPIHRGHINYLNEAKKLGDKLVVGVNSDEWLARKKGKPFMLLVDRKEVVSALGMVDEVILFNDNDDTAKDAIRIVRKKYPLATILFANGGDRTAANVPEMDIQDENIKFVFGVGGKDKLNSSSWILDGWDKDTQHRPWGWWSVLKNYHPHVKVKELVVKPKQKLSMQHHEFRGEFWFVVKGEGSLNKQEITVPLERESYCWINKGEWHQLENTSETDDLHVVEIQFGEKCEESDIIRK